MSLYFSKYAFLDREFNYELNELLATGGRSYDNEGILRDCVKLPEDLAALAKLNGFADDQLSFTEFINQFVDSDTVADASIDGNANVGNKDIQTLLSEMSKPIQKLLCYNKIFIEMRKRYGADVAKAWLRHEYDGHLYMHDASSVTFVPYCFAYDLTRLANEGLFFIPQFGAVPPKHLDTFTQFVEEFVSWNCNRTSGAVGLPDLLIWMYYFWKKDTEGCGCYSLKLAAEMTGMDLSAVDDKTKEKMAAYYRDQSFQKLIYKLNEPSMRGKTQSAFTNVSIYDHEYLMQLFFGKTYPDGTLIVDYIDEIIEFQKDFMRVVSEIRSKNMFTFPVLTYSLLYQDGKFVDEEFAKWACQHNMKWADSNFFVSGDVTSLSNCCRLKNNIMELGYFNSIGGTALQVGSVKVNTINLARLSYEHTNEEDYLEALENEAFLCLKALDVVRHIIRRNVEKGLLPNYALGIIDMSKQYNTIGIMGLYEALQKFGYVEEDALGFKRYTQQGQDFAVSILEKLNHVKQIFEKIVEQREDRKVAEALEAGMEYTPDKYKCNIEQIPGEAAGYKLLEKDRIYHKNEIYELPLYGNQWIPLGVKTTLDEKMRLSALLDAACNGGSIAHFNIDAPFRNFDVAWKMLNKISAAGVTYFAFNTRIDACKHNHGFYGKVCPSCGEKAVTSYQRIVGFLVPENRYSKQRKAEFKLREWTKENDFGI